MKKKCSYNFIAVPPCVSFVTKKYSYLDDFMKDNKKHDQDLMIAHSIKCINVQDSIEIKQTHCIKCMFCVFACPGNKIKIDKDFSLIAKCSELKPKENKFIDNSILESFFKNKLICFDRIKNRSLDIKYKHFDEFTGVNETENISVWGANTFKYLVESTDPRIGLEVGMKITSRGRGGRLDIVVMSNDTVFFIESKVSFRKMVDEKRYVSQLISYEEEIRSLFLKSYPNKIYYKILLIGGSETDLLPINHNECTTKIGNESFAFYENIIKYNFYFVSANALLCLGLLKLNFGGKYSIDNLLNILFRPNVIGLLSYGLIVNDNDIISVKPIDFNF